MRGYSGCAGAEALVALGILTLLLLIITVNGWIGARKDRQLIRQYEAAERGRDKEKADAAR